MACRRSAAEQVDLGVTCVGCWDCWPQFHKCRCSLSHPGDEPRQAMQQWAESLLSWWRTQAVALGYSRAGVQQTALSSPSRNNEGTSMSNDEQQKNREKTAAEPT